jgi:hypothetical protein
MEVATLNFAPVLAALYGLSDKPGRETAAALAHWGDKPGAQFRFLAPDGRANLAYLPNSPNWSGHART